ncbi:MAG: NADP-dependent oxidoreductase [Chlamydiales bacterium]|nr:NADP-dependent oxidoreductase [Chlamydiales bacterium]
MKAVVIEKFGNLDQLHLKELPKPQPLDNEVLIEIAYAGVNPVDYKICEGLLKDRLEHHMPIVLGWDASGIVAAVGANVKNLKVGQKVYAYFRKPTVQWGTYCQFAVYPAEHVVPIPSNVTLAQASIIPLSGLTAWQALFDNGKVKKGQTVLVHAGAGGVGNYAIQFAHWAGAKVYTTASAKNHEYVKRLGADVAIDYNQESFVDRIRKDHPEGVDFVIDGAGGETLEKSYDIIKQGGFLASLVAVPDEAKAKAKGITAQHVFVIPNGKELAEIAKLIEEGKVVPPEVEEMPLQDASKALAKLMQGHTRGKITLKVK